MISGKKSDLNEVIARFNNILNETNPQTKIEILNKFLDSI